MLKIVFFKKLYEQNRSYRIVFPYSMKIKCSYSFNSSGFVVEFDTDVTLSHKDINAL